MDAPAGHPDPILIVIRGNSGSGKSTIARRLQRGHGRGCALVEQDYLRRIVLRERDKQGGIAPGLIARTVRYPLRHGYHVVLEGILHSGRYGDMIRELRAGHRRTHLFYLDVSLDETLRRHERFRQAADFTGDDMRGWYAPHDVLGLAGEHVLPETTTVEKAVAVIAATSGLPLTGRDEDVLPRPRGAWKAPAG